MGAFDVLFQTGTSLHPYGEPDEFISEHRGLLRYEDDKGRQHKVGKLAAYRIQAGQALNQGMHLYDVCDAHSHMMLGVYETLFIPGENSFKASVVDRFFAVELDVLVLEYVVLHPKWRGLRLGLLALRRTIDLLGGGCALAVCEPGPLNPEGYEFRGLPAGWLPRHETPEAERAARKKLRRYVRRMGFERIGRTSLYGLSMARVTPTVEELLRPSAPEGSRARAGRRQENL
jgi:hypothetical protein